MIYVDKNLKDLKFVDYSKIWSEKIELFKKNRIEELISFINFLKEKKNNLKKTQRWEIFKLEFIIDNMCMDLREVELTLKYKGKIPKKVDDRAIEKCKHIFDVWELKLGKEEFNKLRKETNSEYINNLLEQQKNMNYEKSNSKENERN